MIKALFFDFDGTLCDLVETHYIALNEAIKQIAGKSYIITRDEQNKFYNGLSTNTKLQKLILDKNLPKEFLSKIAELKQKFTIKAIDKNINPNLQLRKDIERLKLEGYIIYCVSNALLETVKLGLEKLKIYDLFDCVIGNDNIKRQKPAPDIYLKCFINAGIDPKECLIIEDSKHGREAAHRSGAYVCTVDNEKETTYEHIKNHIILYNKKKYLIPWKDSKLNILLPCAGAGSRFANMGYKLPKPLIDVNGFPMIKTVVDNLNIDANFIFIVQKSHYEEYNLGIILPLLVPDCKIIQVDGLTEGAACTTLLAKELIDNDKHLLIANSDQFVEWDSCDFMYSMIATESDGGILTFKANDPKWSFVKTNDLGNVTEVAEKKPISDDATVGIYYWKKGSEYVRFAEKMIDKNIRVNNEFYVAPVYNEAIAEGKKIRTFCVDKMYGLGTPADLEFFLKNYRG